MAGHNKWSKIKHKKAVTDAKKSQVFGKLARLIAVESKHAGGDISSPGLRGAIEKARAENMPSENIARAVAKGKTDTGASAETVRYETYGPGGVAIVIDGLTDNRNRTAAEIKHLLSEHGYELASPGSASWAFQHIEGSWEPTSVVDLPDEDLAKLSTLVDSLEAHDDIQSVYTNAS